MKPPLKFTAPVSARRPPTPWGRIISRAVVVSAVGIGVSSFIHLEAIGLLAALFALGFLAGAWGRRQGWLPGIIVGFPFSFHQVSRMVSAEGSFSAQDYWRLAVPAAMVAASMAVLGSMTGAWLQDMKLQKEG